MDDIAQTFNTVTPVVYGGTGGETAQDARNNLSVPSRIAGAPGTVDLTSGGQAKFPSVQIPSTDPNILDDYEEGDWTPSILFNDLNVGMTYLVRTGRYQKVGKVVTGWGRIALSTKGSSTGTAKLAGLPFAASSAMSYACGFGYIAGLSGIASFPAGLVQGGGTWILPYNMSVQFTDANFTNTSEIYFHFSYEAAS